MKVDTKFTYEPCGLAPIEARGGATARGGSHVEVENHTGRTLWLGIYDLTDEAYSFTAFPWGVRKELRSQSTTTLHAPRARMQIGIWNQSTFGSMLTLPKAMFTTDTIAVAQDAHGYFCYNHSGEPATIDKVEHFVCLVLENRSFDNLLGWLYAPDNKPLLNIPPPPKGSQPSFDGLVDRKFWNTRIAAAHDSAPEKDRIYAQYGAASGTKPNPNPREVCPSFIEQIFGTSTPAAGQHPNMWGFVQNYAGEKGNTDITGVMECYTPNQVPTLSTR